MNEALRLAWLDQEDALVGANVRRYGVHLVYVGGNCSTPGGCGGPNEGPNFAYVRAGLPAQLRRQGRPVSGGSRLRRTGQAAPAGHLPRLTGNQPVDGAV